MHRQFNFSNIDSKTLLLIGLSLYKYYKNISIFIKKKKKKKKKKTYSTIKISKGLCIIGPELEKSSIGLRSIVSGSEIFFS